MSGEPWSKFFWKDWESDPALKLCSLAAQGLWMRLLCIAAAATVPGHVRIGRRPASIDQIAHIVGKPSGELSPLIDDLESNGVFGRAKDGAIVSRRMVRDAKKYARDKANGKTGGRRKYMQEQEKPDNPPPPENQNPKENPRARARAASASASASQKEKGVQGEKGGDPRLPAEAPWDQRCMSYASNGFWLPQWGPKPGERGCAAPIDLAEAAAHRHDRRSLNGAAA